MADPRAPAESAADAPRAGPEAARAAPPAPPPTDGPGRARARLYPEAAAGGFAAVDGTVTFYTRVRALLDPEGGSTVLDLGAGRGRSHHDDPAPARRRLMDLRDAAARVVGADVDPAVRDNPSLHEARLIPTDGPDAFRWPVADGEVDVVLCDHVLEHVGDPALFAAEARRVLRPGGWLCARAPNRFGYVALAGRAVPEALHARVLRRAQPGRKSEDVFPTHYLLNDRRRLAAAFPDAAWDRHVHFWAPEPAYFGGSVPLWRLARGLTAVLPEALQPVMMAYLRRR